MTDEELDEKLSKKPIIVTIILIVVAIVGVGLFYGGKMYEEGSSKYRVLDNPNGSYSRGEESGNSDSHKGEGEHKRTSENSTSLAIQKEGAEVYQDKSIVPLKNSPKIWGTKATFGEDGKDSIWLHEGNQIDKMPQSTKEELDSLAKSCNSQIFSFNSWDSLPRTINCADKDFGKIWVLDVAEGKPFKSKNGSTSPSRMWSITDTLWTMPYAYMKDDNGKEKALLGVEMSRKFYYDDELRNPDTKAPYSIDWRGGTYAYAQLWERESGGEWKLMAMDDNGTRK